MGLHLGSCLAHLAVAIATEASGQVAKESFYYIFILLRLLVNLW